MSNEKSKAPLVLGGMAGGAAGYGGWQAARPAAWKLEGGAIDDAQRAISPSNFMRSKGDRYLRNAKIKGGLANFLGSRTGRLTAAGAVGVPVALGAMHFAKKMMSKKSYTGEPKMAAEKKPAKKTYHVSKYNRAAFNINSKYFPEQKTKAEIGALARGKGYGGAILGGLMGGLSGAGAGVLARGRSIPSALIGGGIGALTGGAAGFVGAAGSEVRRHSELRNQAVKHQSIAAGLTSAIARRAKGITAATGPTAPQDRSVVVLHKGTKKFVATTQGHLANLRAKAMAKRKGMKKKGSEMNYKEAKKKEKMVPRREIMGKHMLTGLGIGAGTLGTLGGVVGGVSGNQGANVLNAISDMNRTSSSVSGMASRAARGGGGRAGILRRLGMIGLGATTAALGAAIPGAVLGTGAGAITGAMAKDRPVKKMKKSSSFVAEGFFHEFKKIASL